MTTKVISVGCDAIVFEDGTRLESEHDQDCCESHYLNFDYLTVRDFYGLQFDLSRENFFRRIEGYGIELVPLIGHSVKIPGYAENNGYYSSNLNLVLSYKNGKRVIHSIDECQKWLY